jgi:hypothetical protein
LTLRGLANRQSFEFLGTLWGAVALMLIERLSLLVVFAIALLYTLVRLWRNKNDGATAKLGAKGFRPKIGFTRLDGMVSLSLLLDNESNKTIWAEEIEIFLSGLIAEEQAEEPSCHGVQKIRQTIRSGDMLPISLCVAIYKAAGEPQRKYTCVMSSALRYRIGEEWFENKMETCKLQMLGLTSTGIRRERKPVSMVQTQKNSQDVPSVPMKFK